MSQLLEQAVAQVFADYGFGSQVAVYVSPETRIAKSLLSVPQVESVYIDRNLAVTRVWTIIDEDVEHVFDEIYERERIIIREFASDRFDFNVVARRGRELRSFITLVSYPVWMRR